MLNLISFDPLQHVFVGYKILYKANLMKRFEQAMLLLCRDINQSINEFHVSEIVLCEMCMFITLHEGDICI